jgi:hypothetical protein
MRSIKLFGSAVLLLALMSTAQAQTQTDEHKFEAGGLFTSINLADFGTAHGLGGRFGYNFNRHLALDTEFSFFPETHLGNEQFGQKTQTFVGVKAGARTKHLGAFVKARPGLMFIGELTSGFSCNRNGVVTTCRPEHNNFALDLGSVVEVYPSARTIIRLDVGDTIVRERQATPVLFGSQGVASNTTHNFQVSVGFSYRF